MTKRVRLSKSRSVILVPTICQKCSFPQGAGVGWSFPQSGGGFLSILLCVSNRLVEGGLGVEDFEDSAGDVAFQAASDLAIGFAFGAAFGNILASFGIIGHLRDGDHV